jgi:predicted amidohydrolase YtcJ
VIEDQQDPNKIESMKIAKLPFDFGNSLKPVETIRWNFKVLIAVIFVIALSPEVTNAANADLILINGKIITVDPKDSITQAVSISDGKILALGSNDEIRKQAGKNTRVIDLQGRTATPGLIDTHCHFDGASLLFILDLSNVKSITEAVELVRQKVSQVQPGVWVVGSGWDEGKLAQLRYITAADLDPVSPENPVWLWHTTGHYGVANSKALQLAKISAETKDPPAGIIDRGSKGVPTGVLKEDPAMNLVAQLIPPLTHDQQRPHC